jgi:hypothetical protein
MPTTSNGLPYPVGTSTPDVPADLLALVTFLNPAFGWQAYTPTVSGTGWAVSGGATISGRYVVTGKRCDFRIVFTLGTTGIGTGGLTISLPVTGVGGAVASCVLNDVSASTRYSGNAPVFTTSVTPVVGPAAAGGADRNISSTVPLALAVGDIVTVCGTYELP